MYCFASNYSEICLPASRKACLDKSIIFFIRQKCLHIFLHAFFQGIKICCIASITYFFHIRFRKILVRVSNILRSVDKRNDWVNILGRKNGASRVLRSMSSAVICWSHWPASTVCLKMVQHWLSWGLVGFTGSVYIWHCMLRARSVWNCMMCGIIASWER